MASTALSGSESSHPALAFAATIPAFGSPASRLACDVCRLRKTKCDRTLPKCGRCIRLGEPCGYEGHRRDPKEVLTARSTEFQKQRMKAEAQLAGPRTRLALIQPAHLSLYNTDAFTPAMLPSASSSDVHDPLDNFTFPGSDPSTSQPSSILPNLIQPRSYPAEDALMMPEENRFEMDLDWIPDYQFPAYSAPSTILEAADTQLVQTIEFDHHSLTTIELDMLHEAYSRNIYHALPFLNLERFRKELTADPQSASMMALSYGMALVGSTLLPSHSHLTEICYDSARRYIEQCERDESGRHLVSLNLLQAMIFVIRHEITDRQLRRGYLTLGRAIRLMKVLGLHIMDRESRSDFWNLWDLGMRLPPSKDVLLLEERRRTFWILYILESYVTTRTGIPGELAETKTFDVRLPSPGNVDSGFRPMLMPRIGQAADTFHDMRTSTKSSFASCVLMVDLALECFSHSRRRYLGGPGADGFWDNHFRLIKSFSDQASILNEYVNAEAIKNDPIALSVQLNLCATEIFFHETAMYEAERQGLPKHVADESQRLGVEAAFRIAHTIETSCLPQQSRNGIFNVQATFLAWPLAMALKALCPILTSPANTTTSSSVAHALRLLMGALDAAEPIDGHWHRLTASVHLRLQEWDESVGNNRSF